MHVRLSTKVAAFAALVGCSSDITAPTAAEPADGLLVTVAVPGQCVVGGCDPVSATVHTLGLITLANTSDATVFVAACGSVPALEEQQLVNGQWMSIGPAVTCLNGPPSMAIAGHANLLTNAFFAAGARRMAITVSTNQALSGSAASASASFIVP